MRRHGRRRSWQHEGEGKVQGRQTDRVKGGKKCKLDYKAQHFFSKATFTTCCAITGFHAENLPICRPIHGPGRRKDSVVLGNYWPALQGLRFEHHVVNNSVFNGTASTKVSSKRTRDPI